MEAEVTVIFEVVEIPEGVGFLTGSLFIVGEDMELSKAAFTFSLLTFVSTLLEVFCLAFLDNAEDDLKN